MDPINVENAKGRGPYGTNEGDMWLGGGEVAKMLKERDGLTMICEMMVKDGKLQECIYSTKLPELIEMAERGHEQYVAQKVSEN